MHTDGSTTCCFQVIAPGAIGSLLFAICYMLVLLDIWKDPG